MLEEALEFEPIEDGWEARGSARGGTYAYDPLPDVRGVPGAGTVHHIAWASTSRTTRPGASGCASWACTRRR